MVWNDCSTEYYLSRCWRLHTVSGEEDPIEKVTRPRSLQYLKVLDFNPSFDMGSP